MHSSDLLDYRYQKASPLRSFLHMIRPDAGKLALGAIFQIIKHSPVWVMPLLTANIIDLISSGGPGMSGGLLRDLIIGVVVIAQNSPNQMVFYRFLSISARNLEMNLRVAISQRLQHLSIDYYKRSSIGALQSKLLRDVETIQTLLMGTFETLLSAFTAIVVALIVTGIRAPWFLLIYMVLVPLTVLLVRRLRRPIQDQNRAYREELEGAFSRLAEMTQMIPITRAHGVEEFELERVSGRLENVRQAGMRLDSTNALFGSVSFVLFQMMNLFVLVGSAYLYAHKLMNISLGDVILLTGYFNTLAGTVLNLTNLLPQFSKGFDAVQSVGSILECDDLEQNEGKSGVRSVTGAIAFEDVSYIYPGTEEAAVSHVSLQARPDEVIALVGPSGAGKSTLLNLVIGFNRPSAGRILLDGRDMLALDLRTYRRFISVVPQESVFFDGTIRENVTYGNKNISEARLRQALQDANAMEFVEHLPQGLDTLIGERGARLSGGQKQRLAIARALIRDPRVLILDEATSALDSLSETLVQSALERLMKGRTTFVVAHRLSTIRNATRIVVIDQGQVVESGTHDELMQRQGAYYRLHEAQFV
jgi:ATP-binding cassette subfamily B protein